MEAEILIQILLLAAAVYLSFFKSYLTEKGKSAALKEDIQDLTREVEIVRDEFTREQEILKTDLQRILDNEISYRSEERSALIAFHGLINEWLYSIFEIGYGRYNRTNIQQLVEERKRTASFYARAGIAKAKISLLVEDGSLVKAANELFTQSLAFYSWAELEFLKLQQNAEAQISLTDHFLVIFKNLDSNRDSAEKMAADESRLKESARQLIESYSANLPIEYAKVLPKQSKYEALVKGYLKQ